MEDSILLLKIPGKPIALMRHRHSSSGAFDAQRGIKAKYAAYVRAVLRGKYTAPKEIAVRFTFLFKPPKSWSKKKREAAIGRPKLSVPDLSNLIKFTEDALNGILWKDDSHIFRIEAEKCFGEWEGTVIEIFDNGDSHDE